MSDSTEQILSDAVARNLGAVLSLPSAGMLRHHKSRFLSDCPEGIWIESAPQDRVLIDDLILRKQPAAVSFRSSTNKASFAAAVLQRQENYRINAQTTVEAVLVCRPAKINVVQRRTDYRVRVVETSDLRARVWRIAEQVEIADEPSHHQEVPVSLRDLSLGGMGVMISAPPPPTEEGEKPRMPFTMDERVRIQVIGISDQLVLEGRIRHVPRELKPGDKPARVGVQFKNLESNMNGRQAITALTRVIGNLQREEVRRVRLGMVSGDAA